MADIFISYAREDRDWVERLAHALAGEGYSVWWDRELIVGKRYRESIETELLAAKAAIVVWSAHSLQSDFVRDEAEDAHQRNILVPILKELVRPPAGFRQLQTAELTGWTGALDHAEFRRMLKGVSHLVRQELATTDATHVDSQPITPPPPKPMSPPVASGTPKQWWQGLPVGAYVAAGLAGVTLLIFIIAIAAGASMSDTPTAVAAPAPDAVQPATPTDNSGTDNNTVTPTPDPAPAGDSGTPAPADAPPAAPAAPADNGDQGTTPPADQGTSGGDEGQTRQ